MSPAADNRRAVAVPRSLATAIIVVVVLLMTVALVGLLSIAGQNADQAHELKDLRDDVRVAQGQNAELLTYQRQLLDALDAAGVDAPPAPVNVTVTPPPSSSSTTRSSPTTTTRPPPPQPSPTSTTTTTRPVCRLVTIPPCLNPRGARP